MTSALTNTEITVSCKVWWTSVHWCMVKLWSWYQ